MRNLITKAKEVQEEQSGRKTEWLKLKANQKVLVRFVNEFSEDSAHFDPERGLAYVVKEHVSPKNYQRKALCTLDEFGRCWACERHTIENNNDDDYKGWWRPKVRYYTNLLVKEGNKTYPAVWSQGVNNRVPGWTYISEYADATGSVSNLWFQMKRNGDGTETTYSLFPQTLDTEPFDWQALKDEGIEFFDLSKVVREVPYEQQESFYLDDGNNSNGAGAEKEASNVASTNVEWG